MSEAYSVRVAGGSVVTVDAEDSAILSQYSWCHCPKSTAVTAYNKGVGGNIRLHRLILQAPAGMLVDHRNGDVCDNRRSNLRVCNSNENQRNKRAVPGGGSRFKGVALMKNSNKFRAYIFVSRKQKHLGLFATEEEAARAYDAAARLHFGEFCCVNYPQGRERSALHTQEVGQ